jgi:hypothetical protein
MNKTLRPCWFNCYSPDDKKFLDDRELLSIDEMEDKLAPLDERTAALRQIITRFELCYHEADKEAEYIIKSIAAGNRLEQSNERPPQRKEELQNAHDILAGWCRNPSIHDINLEVGDVPADRLLTFLGEVSPVKIWQVERIVDRISEALNTGHTYHRMALDLGDYGGPGYCDAREYYRNDLAFLEQTKNMIIHDTVDGNKSKVSLAMAIDMLMPCHWGFVGSLTVILKAIGGDLYPGRPFTCCSRNISLSPLCKRMKVISNTLKAFWKDDKTAEMIDQDIFEILGKATPVKNWLAASFDKTIRLHMSLPFEVELA